MVQDHTTPRDKTRTWQLSLPVLQDGAVVCRLTRTVTLTRVAGQVTALVDGEAATVARAQELLERASDWAGLELVSERYLSDGEVAA